MGKNTLFLRQYSFEDFFHGGVGYADAEKIMEKSGFRPIEFPHHHNFSLRSKFSRFIYFLKTWGAIKNDDTIVFIFPVFAKMHRLLLRFLSLKKGIRFICCVWDIDGIKDGNTDLLEKEINELKRYRYFIVHNEAMKQWLKGQVEAQEILCIEFFDFLTEPSKNNRKKTKQVAFAGYLAKSTFLESLYLLKEKSPGLIFNLYGPGCTDKMSSQDNVHYKGIVEPYKLPGSIEGSFGLVWDGDSIEGAGGSLGEYMRYISHHKLSLYILSGLPLIVPAMAASAPMVLKYKIGVAINSLYEIDTAIEKISEDDYGQMQENMKPLAEKISNGKCLSDAIQKLMNSM